MKYLISGLIILFHALVVFSQNNRQIINFNKSWDFSNQEDFANQQGVSPINEGFSFDKWAKVTLPHAAKVEPAIVIHPWEGISWYKKDFLTNPQWKNKKVALTFDAVMQHAEIWLNGKKIMVHEGGYLPFTIDISNDLQFEKSNRLLVMADNHDQAEIPPGKPIKDLDFCYYNGIYRNVSLCITSPIYITDAISENKTGSGGLHIWYPKVSGQEASVAIATHIRNTSIVQSTVKVICILRDRTGKQITATSENQIIATGTDKSVVQYLQIIKPALWHPNHPDLYKLTVQIIENGKIIDQVDTQLGIRKFELHNNKLMINGEPLLLNGTNRHQEYPYIGNALSDNAQYRDALKIKEAGFNIIRLSHYPQSPAFMDACDELGLLTIDAIPGWQFIGKDTFKLRSYQTARELIRRDRNHPCVALWELSLNETPMPDNFMQQMCAIATEESSESKLITCGWINKYYDVFIPARQHAKYPDYWKKYEGPTPLFTGEYGDWEYFAQDAGLNQAGYAGLKNDERTSRQFRGDGEKRMLQQALNFQEAHNDNLRSPHLGDANWVMFDYNRGYSPDIESSGIMDIFRLPKFAYYFYKSQQKPDSSLYQLPMVKIASYWNQKTEIPQLKVFSNCDEVALYLNKKLIGKNKSTHDAKSDKLCCPPFIFDIPTFEAGELEAIGYIDNKPVIKDVVNTPKEAKKLLLTVDTSGKPLKADGNDMVFIHATVCDAEGNQVVDSQASILFTINGNAKLIGQNPILAEAGIATILLQAGENPQTISIVAASVGLKSATFKTNSVK